ncbi:hypothetical protein SRHO_G00320980 [Serrasalmus rhombeus]
MRSVRTRGPAARPQCCEAGEANGSRRWKTQAWIRLRAEAELRDWSCFRNGRGQTRLVSWSIINIKLCKHRQLTVIVSELEPHREKRTVIGRRSPGPSLSNLSPPRFSELQEGERIEAPSITPESHVVQ